MIFRLNGSLEFLTSFLYPSFMRSDEAKLWDILDGYQIQWMKSVDFAAELKATQLRLDQLKEKIEKELRHHDQIRLTAK